MSDNLYNYKANVISVYDGDTITVDVDLGFNATLRMNVRLARINALKLRAQSGRKVCRRETSCGA